MSRLAHPSSGIRQQAHLLAQLGGGDHQVDTHAQENHEQTRPRKETLGTQLVLVAALGPDVWGVDRGVPVDVSAVLVSELVHATVLACKMVGVKMSQYAARLGRPVVSTGGYGDARRSNTYQVI